MTITLRAMRYFSSALRHGSIAKAAEELNIAASAVSAAIDQIESHFDLKLVTRLRSRGIAPTASGTVLEQKFNALLDEYDATLIEGSELKQALTGRLRIGYYAPVAPAFLPDILSTLLAVENRTALHLEETDNDSAQAGLLDGRYDAILFVCDSVHPQVEFDPLLEAPAYCLLPASHRLARRKKVSMDEIAREPIIVLNRPVASEYYNRLLASVRKDVAVAAHANSVEMVRSLVGAGYGCAILNMLPVSSQSYAGDRLVALPIADALSPLTLAVGYEKSRPRRIVMHFVEQCRSFFASKAAEGYVVR